MKPGRTETSFYRAGENSWRSRNKGDRKGDRKEGREKREEKKVNSSQYLCSL